MSGSTTGYNTCLMRHAADRVRANIRVGEDWPNSMHELDCLRAAALLLEAADALDAANAAAAAISDAPNSGDALGGTRTI